MTLFQAKLALIALRLEAKSGIKMCSPSKVNTYRLTATALGYPKNSRPSIHTLVTQLEEAIAYSEKLVYGDESPEEVARMKAEVGL